MRQTAIYSALLPSSTSSTHDICSFSDAKNVDQFSPGPRIQRAHVSHRQAMDMEDSAHLETAVCEVCGAAGRAGEELLLCANYNSARCVHCLRVCVSAGAECTQALFVPRHCCCNQLPLLLCTHTHKKTATASGATPRASHPVPLASTTTTPSSA